MNRTDRRPVRAQGWRRTWNDRAGDRTRKALAVLTIALATAVVLGVLL